MFPPTLLLAAVLTFFGGKAGAANEWRQFRGPAQGRSEARGLPLTWSETEHVHWKTALPGEGWSSPVVADGQIWMTTATEDGHSLRALCADLATGRLVHDIEVFRNEVVPPKHRRNSHASPTPILEGGRVYVHFGAMGTACLSTKDGRKLWENRELKIDHQNGPGGSPALFDGRLLIACDGIDRQFGAALDALTGQLAWKTERSAVAKLAARPPDLRKAYGTPVIVQVEGGPQAITTAAERLYAHDPATGRELWFIDYPGFSNVPLPVADGQLLITATGFMKPETWAIRLGGAEGNATATHVLWKQSSGAPDQASPLLVEGRVYLVNNGGIATCLDAATGGVLWKERIASDIAATPLYADGRIYFFDPSGLCTVIAPGDKFQLLAKNQLADGCMASPAVVGKALIVRTKTHLYRIE